MKKWFYKNLNKMGHEYYESIAAKELFGKQLVSLSEKLFWGPFIAFIGIVIRPTEISFTMVFITSLFILGGLYLRDQGLKTIDIVEDLKAEQ